MEGLKISEKKCTKCGLFLPVDEFYKKGNGLRAECKNCLSERAREYRQANKEKINEHKREYYQANKEKIREQKRACRQTNKEKIREQKRTYRQTNKEKISEQQRVYYQANKEKISEQQRVYYQANKEKISERSREYRQTNKEKTREYESKRKKTDIVFAIKRRIRSRIITAIKSQFTEKAQKTRELLGCDYKTFKRHFEKQFTAGMTWELFMQGEIHIDHIAPCAKFDLKDEGQQRACFHYKNLQPLWAAENIAKRDKILEPVQMVLGV